MAGFKPTGRCRNRLLCLDDLLFLEGFYVDNRSGGIISFPCHCSYWARVCNRSDS